MTLFIRLILFKYNLTMIGMLLNLFLREKRSKIRGYCQMRNGEFCDNSHRQVINKFVNQAQH